MTIYEELLNTAKLSQLEEEPMPPTTAEQEHLRWLAATVSSVTKEQFDDMSPDAQAWFDTAAEALNTKGGIVATPPGFGEPKPRVFGRPQRSAAPTPPAPAPAAPPVHLVQTPTPPAPTPPAAPAVRVPQRPFPVPHEPVQAAPTPPAPEPEPEELEDDLEQETVTSEPPAPIRRGMVGNGKPARAPKEAKASARLPLVEGQSMTQRIRQFVIENERVTAEDIIERLERETNQELDAKRRNTVSTLRYDILRTLTMAKQAGWQPPTHH